MSPGRAGTARTCGWPSVGYPRPMRLPTFALAAAFVTSLASMAAADVPSPDQTACQGKSLGASCTPMAGGAGSCQNSTCSKALPNGDGGVTTTSYACVLCVAGDAGTGNDAGGDAGGSVGGGSSSSGCSVGRTGSMLGAFAIAMAVPLLVRRRRRS